jgi:hypothetical protein
MLMPQNMIGLQNLKSQKDQALHEKKQIEAICDVLQFQLKESAILKQKMDRGNILVG